MILLLGGASETEPIALRLDGQGYRVLVSQATDIPLATRLSPSIECRFGSLEEQALAELIDRRAIRAIVDATHPYAIAIRAMAARVAAYKGIVYLRYLRPKAVESPSPGVVIAPDHEAAAAIALGRRRPVLLTIGSRNLRPYVEQARQTGVRLVARVLDHASSWDACQRAGILPENIISGRGPFSVEVNRQHIRRFGIGVLVTKDGGVAGGVIEKLEAARAEGCDVIVVARPATDDQNAVSDIDSLIAALVEAVPLDFRKNRPRSQPIP